LEIDFGLLQWLGCATGLLGSALLAIKSNVSRYGLGRLRRVQRRLDRLRALEWRDRPGRDAVGFLCDNYPRPDTLVRARGANGVRAQTAFDFAVARR